MGKMKEVFMETKEWESINDYDYQYQQYINVIYYLCMVH
jgi:hypothetical protein